MLTGVKAGLSSGGWGMLGGGIGGGITSALPGGWTWGSAIVGGATAGGVVGGLNSLYDSYRNGDTWGAALKNAGMASLKGAIVGGAIGAAAQGINKFTKFGIDTARRSSRPNFRKGVKDKIWDENKDVHGRVRDPGSGKYMSKNNDWDAGHKPGHEYRKQVEFAENNHWTQKTFNDHYNKTENYRPELPSSNRSHAHELKTDDYFGSNY